MAAHIPLRASAVYYSFWKHLMSTKHVCLNTGKMLASGEWWNLNWSCFGQVEQWSRHRFQSLKRLVRFNSSNLLRTTFDDEKTSFSYPFWSISCNNICIIACGSNDIAYQFALRNTVSYYSTDPFFPTMLEGFFLLLVSIQL